MIISVGPNRVRGAARARDRQMRAWARGQSRSALRGFGALAPTEANVQALPIGATRASGIDELVNLSAPATVYYSTAAGTTARVFAPGGTRCKAENFYSGSIPATLRGGACSVLASEASPWVQPTSYLPGGYPERGNSIARKVAEQGQPFTMSEAGTVYYGTSYESWNRGAARRFQVHDMLRGTYLCDNDPFGPDPISGVRKACFVVPHIAPEVAAPITYDQRLAAQHAAEERATTATQAQQNLYQAQLAIQQEQADAQAQLAQLARDAASQQAAAQRAAETYRAIQEEASRQAAEMAAELARIAYANEHDQELARQAAEVAAESESIRQATEEARRSEEERARATLAAQAAAIEMLRTQEQYEARLEVTQNAAATQADLTAAAAAGGVEAPFDWKKIALFGGLGLAAVFVLMSDE